jgi:hypothetical protein
MAGRFINPYPQFMDSTPDVYSGGKLWFYASGTDTPLSTYTTKALSVANTNPVTLNSAGYPNTDIFLQDLEYKVVLKDSSSNTIWTADPVSHRDSALVAKTLTGSGSPNGSVAGTAGSSGVLPDFYWDYTNSILYVCTTTGTSSTAVWTAVNASSAAAAVPPPQGRLTLTSATPILAADVISATAVYYTPYLGNLVPIYNGATMTPTEFAELTLTLSASHALNTLYDVFVFSNSGVLTLVTGPAWATSTAAAGARGSGASTTQLTRIKGLWVNAVAMTARNGATTYSVGANLATFLGSLYIDGTAGQITCHILPGQSRKHGVSNAYNRSDIALQVFDSTASWTWGTNAWHSSNANAANSCTIFSCLPEEKCFIDFGQTLATSGAGVFSQIGIGYNSTTVLSGRAGNHATAAQRANVTAAYMAVPFIGINVVNCIEKETTGTLTAYGGTEDMLLIAKMRG